MEECGTAILYLMIRRQDYPEMRILNKSGILLLFG
jgi:hypothetical protein